MQLLIGHGQVPTIMPEASHKHVFFIRIAIYAAYEATAYHSIWLIFILTLWPQKVKYLYYCAAPKKIAGELARSAIFSWQESADAFFIYFPLN